MKKINGTARNASHIAVLAIATGSMLTESHAEGAKNEWLNEGAFGANRVVRSKNGFIGVSGHFTVPLFFIPARYINNDPAKPYINPDHTSGTKPIYKPDALQPYLDSNPSPRPYAYASNPNNTKPTFYVGSGAGTTEVDAGIQWEWLQLFGTPPGWAANLNKGYGHWDNPTVSVPGTSGVGPFRAGPGTNHPDVTSFQLEHTIAAAGPEQGGVYLKVRMFPQNLGYRSFVFSVGTEHTSADPAIYQPNQIANDAINVKRVIGITQQRAATLDGSWMTGCVYSQGQMATIDPTGGIGWSADWRIADVDNLHTGYLPGALPTLNGSPNPNWPAWDKDLGLGKRPRKFKIDFPALTTAANTAGVTNERTIREQWHNAYNGANATLAARYSQEAVDIYLRRGGKVSGITVSPRRAVPRK